MNDSRIVCLAAQILQTCGAVGIVIVRVIEGIEEIRRKPYVRPLFDFEVLEDREVRIPRTGTDDVGSRTEVVKVPHAGIETTTVCQRHCQPVGIEAAVAIRSKRAGYSLTPVHRHQGRQVSSRDIGRAQGVEISYEPQPLSIAENGQLQPPIGSEARIPNLESAGVNAPPKTASPIADGGNLPTTD